MKKSMDRNTLRKIFDFIEEKESKTSLAYKILNDFMKCIIELETEKRRIEEETALLKMQSNQES